MKCVNTNFLSNRKHRASPLKQPASKCCLLKSSIKHENYTGHRNTLCGPSGEFFMLRQLAHIVTIMLIDVFKRCCRVYINPCSDDVCKQKRDSLVLHTRKAGHS
jgi:hypothetical protein